MNPTANTCSDQSILIVPSLQLTYLILFLYGIVIFAYSLLYGYLFERFEKKERLIPIDPIGRGVYRLLSSQ
mgnify:CR=1 FL=1